MLVKEMASRRTESLVDGFGMDCYMAQHEPIPQSQDHSPAGIYGAGCGVQESSRGIPCGHQGRSLHKPFLEMKSTF